MVTSEYWPLDVFRPGILQNVKFGAEWTMYGLSYCETMNFLWPAGGTI